MPTNSTRTPSKTKKVDETKTPQATPTRKAPHCRQCQRPKKGHPARGCPFTEALSSPTVSDAESDAEGPQVHAKTATPVLKVPTPAATSKTPTKRVPLQAKGPTKNEATPPDSRDRTTREQPVPSPKNVRATTKRALKVTSTDNSPDKPVPTTPAFKVWKDPSVTEPFTKNNPQSHSKTPRIQTRPDPKLLFPFLQQDTLDDISFRPNIASTPQSNGKVAARSAFISSLSERAGASIHFVPTKLAATLEKEAHELGMKTALFRDEGDDESLLIVGRCQFAVDRFLQMGGVIRAPKGFGSKLNGATTRGRTSV